MSRQELSKQLIQRIFENLGLANIGMGLTDRDNILEKTLKLEEEDSSVKKYTVWGGECYTGEVPLEVVASNIGTTTNPDFIVIVKQSATVLAMRYSWGSSDYGMFLIQHNKKWVDMEVLHQLNLTSAIELIAQNGLPWTKASDPQKLYELLTSVLSCD